MFIDQLVNNIKATRAPLVIGLDPNLDLIPVDFKKNYTITPENYFETVSQLFLDYNKAIIDQIADLVPAIKPQMAYYEVLGHHGLMALKATVEYAQSKGLLIILDGKRNDIPSTAQAYVEAYLASKHHKPYLEVDSITVTPFLGMDSLEPFYQVCRTHAKGLFICLKTSNAGSGDLQDKVTQSGKPMYEELAALINSHAKTAVGQSGYSSVGVVVGATYPEKAAILRDQLPQSYFLVPGIGHQGGDIQKIGAFFRPDGLGALLNASRSVMYPAPGTTIRYQAQSLIQLIQQNLPI